MNMRNMREAYGKIVEEMMEQRKASGHILVARTWEIGTALDEKPITQGELVHLLCCNKCRERLGKLFDHLKKG